MKKLIFTSLGTIGLLALASCESVDEDVPVHRTTTVTEETTVRSHPYATVPGVSRVVETETTQTSY